MKQYFRLIAYVIVITWISTSHAGAFEDFFQAVNRDDGDTVATLVKRGFDVNSRNADGQTGLHLALRDQSPRVTNALWADRGLDVNAVNGKGETPLMMAALRGDLEWSRRLIERGAKVHKEGWSPIHYAATGPEPRVVALLLDRGAPIDAPGPNRSNAADDGRELWRGGQRRLAAGTWRQQAAAQ